MNEKGPERIWEDDQVRHVAIHHCIYTPVGKKFFEGWPHHRRSQGKHQLHDEIRQTAGYPIDPGLSPLVQKGQHGERVIKLSTAEFVPAVPSVEELALGGESGFVHQSAHVALQEPEELGVALVVEDRVEAHFGEFRKEGFLPDDTDASDNSLEEVWVVFQSG